MRRIIVKHLAGSKATKPTVARRLARKIQGAIAQRQCLLVDFEGTTASSEFLETLLAVAEPTKVRFCGLPSAQQELVNFPSKGDAMNGRILRPPGEHHSILDIGQADRDKIAQLGKVAKAILSAQDQDHWAQAGDPDLLPRVIAGAIILERIGQRTEAIMIEDDGAHLAFMTCNALTILTPNLNQECLRTLEETLKLLAMCCLVETTVQDLPPLEFLPASFQRSALILRQYQLIQETDSSPREITLADALALFRIFRVADSRQFSAALAEVSEMSEGLRAALRRLKETTE